jgi:carbonic anhydrase/acetyltransferase-like protein (isoleucine patch superfamily)
MTEIDGPPGEWGRLPLIMSYKGISPNLGAGAFVAPFAVVLGAVDLGDKANVWFHSVVRGDVHSIKIGAMTNIQDHCVLHVTGGKNPIVMGQRVMVGHRAVLHGCEIHDNALIGIGALVLDTAVVEESAVVAAGAIVTPGTVIPSGMIAMGAPAKPVRPRTTEELDDHHRSVENYAEYAENFKHMVGPVTRGGI